MDSIYKSHQPGSSDELYLKLRDGDRVRVRIASEPACSSYDGVKLRYAWIVWNRDKNKPQVFSFGISIYNQVADLVEEWGEPTTFDIVIKRTGSGLQDTTYSVTPVKQSDDLTKAELDEVNKIDLPKAIRGKWLAEYEQDHTMPEPISNASTETVPLQTQQDAPMELSDIPPDFLA